MDSIIIDAAEQPTPHEFFSDPSNLAAVPPALRQAIDACQRYEAYAPRDSNERPATLAAIVKHLIRLGFSLARIQGYLECPISESMRPGENEYDDSDAFHCGAAEVERAFYAARPPVYGSTVDMLRAFENTNTPQCERERLRGLIALVLVLKDPNNPGVRYVMGPDGTYTEYPAATCATSCGELLAWAHARGLDGALRMETARDWSETQAQNSRLAKTVVHAIAAPATYYDPTAATLTVAFYAAPKVGPLSARDARDIDRYLCALAGARVEPFKDWLATLHRLDRPSSWLFLRGRKGVGKTATMALIASAAPGSGVPVDMRQVVQQHNDGLDGSAFVVAEEGAPGHTHDGIPFVQWMRDQSTRTTLDVRRMYRRVETLRGSLRYGVTFNSPTQLPFGANLSDVDAEAIARRILYIVVPDEAGRVLQELGGFDRVAQWRESGAFAAYVAQLAATRAVKPGLLLVDGVGGDELLRECARAASPNAAVLNVLAKCIAEPANIAKSERGSIIVRDGDVWVNAALLSGRTWSAIEPTEPAPTTRRAGMALASVGIETRSMGATRAKYTRLDIAALASATDMDPDALRQGVAVLAAPLLAVAN